MPEDDNFVATLKDILKIRGASPEETRSKIIERVGELARLADPEALTAAFLLGLNHVIGRKEVMTVRKLAERLNVPVKEIYYVLRHWDISVETAQSSKTNTLRKKIKEMGITPEEVYIRSYQNNE